MQQHINIKPIISILLVVAIFFTIIVVIGKILIPFIVALILTYILNPLVEKINKKLKIKRSFTALFFSILVFLIFTAIPLFIIPSFAVELKTIITKIPDLVTLINSKILTAINQRYDTHFAIDLINIRTLLLKNVTTAYNHVNIFSPLAKNSFILIEIVVYIVLIPFILFYSICGWHNILAFFNGLIPRSYVRTVKAIIHDIDIMLSAYLRGQFSVMLIMAFYYAIAIYFVDIPFGFMIGFVTGLMVFIPYLGISTGLLIALAVTVADFSGINQVFAILGIFAVGHIIEGGLVTPFLVGGKIGLNPVMIILALMIFGHLFGFVGILLALPLSTITIVLLKYAKMYYTRSSYYNEES